MPRPSNKTQLLAEIEKAYQSLEGLLSQVSANPPVVEPGAWAVKDILAHLHEWQQMFLGWYSAGLRGETPAVPAPGYKWSQLPALNQRIYETYAHLSHNEAAALFRRSHQQTLQFIAGLADGDLTTPGLYPWMNRNTLMAYLDANTAAHYEWARKEIRKLLKRTTHLPLET